MNQANQNNPLDSDKIRNVAAIDLGSNSFHMVVAKVVGQELQLVSRHKQRVRLALGLDSQKNISNSAIERGLECLAMFAERLSGFDIQNVRIAATHTLRQANNAHIFIQRAQEVLPFPIEIIPGEEEARLIYLGVAHTQTESPSKLVIDIGGGSTELIIGHGLEAKLVNSKQMGCVSFSDKYFADGTITKHNFMRAMIATEQRLEPLASKYRKRGWDLALGSSGTIKAIKEVLVAAGHSDGIINAKRLAKLIEQLCEFSHVDNIKLAGLNEERKPVFAAGVAILGAIINDLKITELHYSDGALREGLLYEMEERFERCDIRMRTTENLANKHLVDLEHASRVKKQAHKLLKQTHKQLGIGRQSELFDLLKWAALLHEVGLSISFQAFHRHSAYLLRHTNMPGFNREQQLVLSALTRFQRKALKLHEMPPLSLFKNSHIIGLIRILRLSILINGQRNDTPMLDLEINLIDHDHWQLDCSNKDWLEENKLLAADLAHEQELWDNAGWQLSLASSSK
ncbi:exopolyphosphatase [Vibrio sp. T187]|uniref:exopolyphosphatase n=1 Tax=Vibrio TaxID=662 RepID=UPI0010CA1631|nr:MULTISPECIES: exopolyphosphatase [Vibrio]MBW3697900.1 exopolyphosphatase [Vibrio sp. T187]